ncbi:MAG: hypothetical protein WCA98_07550, partial [Candidatus Acidiferrales bacterium]
MFKPLIRSLQLPARSFGSHLQNIAGWRFSQLAREHALEIPNAHPGSVRYLVAARYPLAREHPLALVTPADHYFLNSIFANTIQCSLALGINSTRSVLR